MSRLPLRLTEIVAVLVALVLAYLITSHFEVSSADMKPFVRSVGAGQTAHLSYADVKVRDVRTARALAPLYDQPAVVPAGIFVLVSVELTPTRAPVSFATSRLVDDQGRRYLPSEKSSCSNALEASAGLTTYALVCFEIPPSLIGQVRLEVARGAEADNDLRNDDVADLDLGISSAQARTLAAPTAAYQVQPASLEPFTPEEATIDTGDTTGDTTGDAGGS